jgi:hypothetical protein
MSAENIHKLLFRRQIIIDGVFNDVMMFRSGICILIISYAVIRESRIE